jgi:thymidylate synthase (FAD)
VFIAGLSLSTENDEMTDVSEIRGDANYVEVLDRGFVGLVNVMGNDEMIERAARVSYGAGTRAVNDRRNLLRYLMRHYHTSPFEFGEVAFHVKMPILVARQLFRHRMQSINEQSARYSVLTDEFYYPTEDRIQAQSKTNKQGSEGDVPQDVKEKFLNDLASVDELTRTVYEDALGNGISRELARMVLPVAQYTECYIKVDMNNFLKMLRLRTDSHAQQEIQEYANAMEKLVEPHFPLTIEAYRDYHKNARSVSRMEKEMMLNLLAHVPESTLRSICFDSFGMGKREFREFIRDFFPDKYDTVFPENH